ncbi:MAG: MoaD/ThiS family protein [Deltaproteobacteria bacterium]|nr:MoaD/ThiS family protein [Deltaproteobacteria bacterium]
MPATLRVTIEFMGPFEFDFGVAGAELTLAAPATVGSLLQELARRWPAAQSLRAILAAGGSPRGRYCYVSIDYVMLKPDAALAAPLHDGARVCFGMPMVGG